MNEGQLKSLCTLWQKRLQLTNWKITIELVPCDSALPDIHDAWGAVEYDDDLTAKIIIRDSDMIEWTLVHELLHIVFKPLEENMEDENLKEEDIIDILADSFIKAYASEN